MTIEEIAVQLQRIDDRSKSNTKRLDEHEEWQKERSGIIEAVGRIDEKVDIFNKNINEKVDVLIGSLNNQFAKTEEKVQQIADKPRKRWDAIVDKILLAIVSAIVLYMMSKLGF